MQEDNVLNCNSLSQLLLAQFPFIEAKYRLVIDELQVRRSSNPVSGLSCFYEEEILFSLLNTSWS